MSRCMTFDFGLETKEYSSCIKQKNRWLFIIPFISADTGPNALPPLKSARPQISFKTMDIQHLNEIIYRPSKPDWKPINLVLYDLKKTRHPVFDWLQRQYDPSNGDWYQPKNQFIIDQAKLELYDGCGEIIETWIYENLWPETIEFGDLNMGEADFITCDLTLRYDRAYIKGQANPSSIKEPERNPYWMYTPGMTNTLS